LTTVRRRRRRRRRGIEIRVNSLVHASIRIPKNAPKWPAAMVLHRFDGAQDIRRTGEFLWRALSFFSPASHSPRRSALEVKAGVDSTLPTGRRYEEGQGGGGEKEEEEEEEEWPPPSSA